MAAPGQPAAHPAAGNRPDGPVLHRPPEQPARNPTTGDSEAEDLAARDSHLPAGNLAASLWPLETWAATAEALLAHIERTRRPADRFTALAAAVRHLLADPVLPPELLPEGWPGPELRAAYTTYRRELVGTVLRRTD